MYYKLLTYILTSTQRMYNTPSPLCFRFPISHRLSNMYIKQEDRAKETKAAPDAGITYCCLVSRKEEKRKSAYAHAHTRVNQNEQRKMPQKRRYAPYPISISSNTTRMTRHPTRKPLHRRTRISRAIQHPLRRTTSLSRSRSRLRMRTKYPSQHISPPLPIQ